MIVYYDGIIRSVRKEMFTAHTKRFFFNRTYIDRGDCSGVYSKELMENIKRNRNSSVTK